MGHDYVSYEKLQYLGVIPRSNELYHHGIKGQKWGVRNGDRYPLEPSEHSAAEKKAGAKGAEGGKTKSAEGGKKGVKKKKGLARAIATGDVGGIARSFTTPLLPGMFSGERSRASRAYKLNKKAKKAEAKGKEKKAEKLAKKAKAQRQKNADVKKYLDKSSTKKLVLQNALMTNWGADRYRSARARGAGRARALIESNGLSLAGQILRRRGDKKKYRAITHSGL